MSGRQTIVDTPPFRPGTTLDDVTINVVMNVGGLGDMIARIPAIRYKHSINPHVTINLWCPDYFIPLAKIFLKEYGRINILHIDDYKTNVNWDEPQFDFSHAQHTSFSTNLTRYAFNVLVNKEVDESYLVYPEFPVTKLEADRYVVITSNYTALARRFMDDQFNQLVEWFIDQEIRVMLLGLDEIPVKGGKCGRSITSERIELTVDSPLILDYRNTTNILEAANYLGNAMCVLGVDNGLIHLAATTDAPIVAGYTTVSPKHRVMHRPTKAPVYNVLPELALPCKFCQSEMDLIYGHKFRFCKWNDYLCCQDMTADKFRRGFQALMTVRQREESCAK